MGIDAKMMIRYRGEKPTEKQLATWSWDLCRAIGARHFFISDGMPAEQYEKAETAWHIAFKEHPLYPRYRETYDGGNIDRVAHQAILDGIGKPPERLRRAIDFSGAVYGLEDSDIPDTHAKPGLAWSQDGPPVLAKPGEWLLSVSLWTRYYGVDYERGDILTLCAIAEWIETNMQPCEVWYGGDSGGACVELFDEAARKALKAHLFGQHGRDYFNHEPKGGYPTPKPCGLCIPGEPRFNRHGWGGNYVAVNCGGCGKSFESRDNGKTWVLKKDD